MLSLVKIIKSLRETNENLKAQLIDRSTLKLSHTHRNVHTRNDNISELNIEETVIITPRISQNDHTRKIHRTRIQLKEYRAKIYEKYASLRNSQGFEKELDRPEVTK